MDQRITSARIIEVIETVEVRGEGREDSPIREVTTYWLPNGTKIGEQDPIEVGFAELRKPLAVM